MSPRTKDEIYAAFEQQPPQWDLKSYAGCCQYLRFLRDESCDVIPQHIIHSDEDPYLSKARKTWWRGFLTVIYLMLEQSLIPPEKRFSVQAFYDTYETVDFLHGKNPTRSADIDAANAILNFLIGD